MRYLITGGAGFIGSALTRHLLGEGDAVTILDLDIDQGRLDPAAPGLTLVEGDVRDLRCVDALARDADVIVHLASHVGVRWYLGEPVDTVSTTIDGAVSCLEVAIARALPLVAFSTSEVYGMGPVPMTEGQNLLYGDSTKTRWVYGMAKGLADSLMLAAVTRGLDLRIVRPFNVVGPRQSPEGGLVFPSFVNAVRSGGPLVVHGDGLQTRTFCHVDDIIRGTGAILASPEASGRVVNLGGTGEVSVLQVAQEFQAAARELGYPAPPIVFRPHLVVYGDAFEDTRRRVPDLGLAERLIGWRTDSLMSRADMIRDAILTASPQ